MVNNEIIAYEWLKDKFPTETIEKITNPDFKVGEKYFEAKSISNNRISLTSRQLETFDSINPFLILVNKKNIEKVEKWSEVKNKIKYNKIGKEDIIIKDFNNDKAVCYPDVTNIGGSLGVIIPKDVCELVNLTKGDKLELTFEVIGRGIDKKKFNENGEIIMDNKNE